jgi:hypothetical protein
MFLPVEALGAKISLCPASQGIIKITAYYALHLWGCNVLDHKYVVWRRVASMFFPVEALGDKISLCPASQGITKITADYALHLGECNV